MTIKIPVTIILTKDEFNQLDKSVFDREDFVYPTTNARASADTISNYFEYSNELELTARISLTDNSIVNVDKLLGMNASSLLSR